MYFSLFLSMSLLNYGFTQKKKGDGVAEDQRKQSADGRAAADEIQICDTERKHLFLPQWKTKWPWGSMKRKRV